MKKQEFINQVTAGKPLLVVEYRSTVAEDIRRSNPKAGEAAVMPVAKHRVLVGDKSYDVTEFLPDGAKVSEVKAPFNPRDLVVIEVTSMEDTKWGSRITGKFHGKLE